MSEATISEQLMAACGNTAEAKAAVKEIERLQARVVALEIALHEIDNLSMVEVRETQSSGTIRGNQREINRIARAATKTSSKPYARPRSIWNKIERHIGNS